MDFGFSEQEEAFRREVRDFIKGKIPEDVKFGFLRKTDRYVQDYATCFQQLGKKGWLCVDWPQEYGGLGYPLIARGIVMEELGLAGIERPNIATSCLGRSRQVKDAKVGLIHNIGGWPGAFTSAVAIFGRRE